MKALTLAAIFLAATAAPILSTADETKPAHPDPMLGKQKTDRTILLETVVAAPPDEVFRLWTSVDGIKKFFAPEARIEANVGGRYQIIFAPARDPEGDSHGTKGARILKLVPNRELAFEWVTFAGDESLGRNAPPYAPATERNVRPLPTWVELNFDSIPGKAEQTRVRFAHYGFQDGEKWEKSFRWFERAWKGVLDQLAAYCQDQKSSAK